MTDLRAGRAGTLDAVPGGLSGLSGALEGAFADLAAMLWQERQLLEHLLFTLSSQQLILRAGDIRWLAASDDQVAAAVHTVRESEVLRAVEVHDLIVRLGVEPETTLSALAARAPAPWDTMLLEHRDALRELVAEIGTTTGESRRLLQAGADATRETLGHVTQATSVYSSGGLTAELAPGPFVLDRLA